MTVTDVATLTRRLLEWVQRPGNRGFLCEQQRAIVECAAQDPLARAQLPVAAWFLGTWHLALGQARVLQGDGTGFEEQRHGVQLMALSLRLRLARHVEGRAGEQARPASLLQLAHVTALGMWLDEDHSLPVGQALLLEPRSGFRGGDHWAMFVQQAQGLLLGQRANLSTRMGIYAEVLGLWNGDAATLGRALGRALDHHLERTGKVGRDAGEFQPPWLSLLPLVALVPQRMRQRFGLPWHKVDHPLMFTNLVTMPHGARGAEHECVPLLLAEIAAAQAPGRRS